MACLFVNNSLSKIHCRDLSELFIKTNIDHKTENVQFSK